MYRKQPDAVRLAVAYHAYQNAVAKNDLDGILVWGPMLLEAQAICHVAILPNALIQARIALTKRDAA